MKKKTIETPQGAKYLKEQFDEIDKTANTLNLQFAEIVKQVKKTYKITNAQIAKAIDRSPSYVANLIKGKALVDVRVMSKIGILSGVRIEVNIKQITSRK